jgi:hypothetical protein
MKRLYEEEPDFEALIRIYSHEEGGREKAPCNGIRWKFAYAGDPMGEVLYAIWPDFVDEHGNSMPEDAPLPIGVELPARMTVDIRGTREVVHRHRVFEGVRFFCHEQSRRVAEGRVTRITGLNS